jgi:mannose-6-phosphate isomerase
LYQTYLWGGRRLSETYRRTPPGGTCAESWEISDRDDGMSVVAEGPLAGTRLRDLMERDAEAILGRGAVPGARFPLLVKILDARETLSVQVHPDDDSAALVNGEAKSEMWYLLDAAEDAVIYRGLQPGTDRDAMEQAIADGEVERVLVRCPVERDDAAYIPGGTVHAIGAGCLILEIQQNSNTTFRIHDWGRTGPDGRPRELHLDQAVRVIRWNRELGGMARPVTDTIGEAWILERVMETPYFRIERLTVSGSHSIHPRETGMTILFVQEGEGTLSAGSFTSALTPGCTWLLPASLEACELTAGGDPLRVITARLPA